MTPRVLGRRREPFASYDLLLFPDHLEEVGNTFLALEVRRLFFDELESATVHKGSGAAEALLCLLAGGVALLPVAFLWGIEVHRLAALKACAPVAALFFAAALFFVFVRPPVLTVRAPGQAFRARLPWRAARRETRLRSLVEAVQRFQDAAPRPSGPEGEAFVVSPGAG